MLWIVLEDSSHQIVSCNIHTEDDLYQVWVTRSNGKSLKLDESKDKKAMLEIKEAIDYAIETKETTLRLA